MANKTETNAETTASKKEPMTTIGIDHNERDIASSLLAVTKHLMVFPPAYTTDDYNLGVQLLFDIIRSALHMDDEGRVWETGVM